MNMFFVETNLPTPIWKGLLSHMNIWLYVVSHQRYREIEPTKIAIYTVENVWDLTWFNHQQ